MTDLDRSKTYYIAGPMSGIPQFNFPAFDEAAKRLREQGYSIISPSEMDDPEIREAAMSSPDGKPTARTTGGQTWADFLARDVKLIADKVQGIIVLPGWGTSKGARLEVFVGLLCGHSFGWYHNEEEYAYPASQSLIRHQLKEVLP